VNANSCTFYDNGNSATANNRNGIMGCFGSGTHILNIFNCLVWGATVDTHVAYNGATGATTATCNSDNNIYYEAEGFFVTNEDAHNETGNSYSVDFVEGNPASGEVGIVDTTGTGGWDLSLFDDATDNAAQAAHSTTTGTQTSLVLPTTDIAGQTRSRAANEVDVGAHALTLDSGTSPLVLYTSPGLSVTNP
jgi:hypothetical protein